MEDLRQWNGKKSLLVQLEPQFNAWYWEELKEKVGYLDYKSVRYLLENVIQSD